jgi:regulator of protease activity HflC (stomatin/prohibitin superfamily)
MLWTLLFIVTVGVAIAVSIFRRMHEAKIEARIQRARADGRHKEEEIEAFRTQEVFPIPAVTTKVLAVTATVFLGLAMWNQIFFYAEPGYVYHVRTIAGQERVIDDVGYNYHLFGNYNAWKKAMSVQASSAAIDDSVAAEDETSGGQLSANLPPERIVFLDQVDARVQAVTRFLLPTDRESFLRIAREYRSPENLLRTGLIPAFRETLQANASLMGAEEYYSGGRTEFNNEFEQQMKSGIYLVRREEVVIEDDSAAQAASANVSITGPQKQFDDGTKVVFQVEKEYDETGQLRRKPQQFVDYGITVIDARITDVEPNKKFIERMELKQKAAADRAIAREQRIQEEEQKLLAEARGQREVAERKAAALVKQVEQTTNAETEKQLALTEAQKLLEQAEIDKQTSEIRLAQAEIDAERQRTLADAAAYEKEVILQADNALAQKLETEVEIQKVWAEAYAKRAVPQYVFGGGSQNGDGTPTGSDFEVQSFMKLMTMDAAKRLNYNREVAPAKQ